jgi:type I restriction enzyme S subunit
VRAKPYPRYKSSEVEWLGDLPEHWAVKRLRRVLVESLQYGANESAELDDPDLPRYVRITDVHENGTLRPETFRSLPKDVAAPYLLQDGDLLFARSGATSGKTFLYQSSWGVCAYAGYLIRARMNQQKAVPAFIKYFTTSTSYWQWLSSIFIQSTIQNVSAEKYADLQLSLPPLPEQRAIAGFLDRETARVDRLVAKKRELIERLKEKRTALISRTVTRGLPPAAAGLPENPPLKPSGLDWLGDIPNHWDIKPVKFVARIGNGSTPSRDNPSYWEEGDYPWLNSSVVNQETISEAEDFVTTVALRECHLPKIAPPAVLIGITGQGRTRGMASTLMFEATINQHVAFLKPYPSRADVGFLRRVFDMVYLFLRSESDGGGSTKGAITCEQIANLKIPIPPLPEQASIAAYLDKQTGKLDALVGKVEEAVERLQEYRTALITAAVTGKIDVRKESNGK